MMAFKEISTNHFFKKFLINRERIFTVIGESVQKTSGLVCSGGAKFLKLKFLPGKRNLDRSEMFFFLQWNQLDGITLGKIKRDNINRTRIVFSNVE